MVDPKAVAPTSQARPQVETAVNPSRGARSKSIYQRLFEFIDAHPGCLTRDITAHMGRSVRKLLDEMDRGGVIVRVTKHDRYSCADGREKRHFTADQHVGHIGRYGVQG